LVPVVLSVLFVCHATVAAQVPVEKVDSEIVTKIKAEGTLRSKVMDTASYLTDVHGPRLTGSPEIRSASEWAKKQLAAWGLENAHLEPWGPFGRGWSLEGFTANMTEPQFTPLIAYPKAWSSSTSDVLRGVPIYLEAAKETDLEQYKGKLKGAIVLIAPPREVKAHFDPQGTRQTDERLLQMANADSGSERRRPRSPEQPQPGTPGQPAPTTPDPTQPPAANQPSPEQLAGLRFQSRKWEMCYSEGAGVVLEPGRGDGGTLFVQSAATPPSPQSAAGTLPQFGRGGPRPWAKDAPPIIPQAVLAAEHYNRLVRMIKRGATPKLEIAIKTKYHDDDLMSANVVGEIPGTDLKDEVVMLGGHFDAWHAGTGATDNAAGSAVCMEAVRILKAIDAKPRRTIRIALWTGEEEGLLGSKAYVTDHFGRRIDTPRSNQPRPIAGGADGAAPGGTAQPGGRRGASGGEGSSQSQQSQQPGKYELKPDHAKFAAYFNLDNGTGKIRGVHLQGNDAVRPIFRAWLAPFKDRGASTLTLTNTGGTDHLSFDAVGLPGFQFIQDEIEYESRTHHSNMDVYDRLQEDDLKQASMIMATFVYHAAMRDEKLPRKLLVGEVVTTSAQ
jgi:hypothetical protein